MSNKKLGNRFEREFAQMMYNDGFWVHLLQQNSAGQPADIIAVRNQKAFLIDCKVCSTSRGFALSRIEDNQMLAMRSWENHGNGDALFAMKFEDEVIVVTFAELLLIGITGKAYATYECLKNCGVPYDKWVKEICK